MRLLPFLVCEPTPLRRALFLDFDGVLHPAGLTVHDVMQPIERIHARRPDLFCHVAVVDELLRPHPDVEVWVHSGWRLHQPADVILPLLGPLQSRLRGITSGVSRHASILDAVSTHGIDDYRILDDLPEEFDGTPAELILCDPALGVSCPTVRGQLVQWLELSPARSRAPGRPGPA